MKILFLVHRIPYPPDKGEKIRAFHELKYLGAEHTIDFFCFADSAEEAKGQWRLRDFCRSIYVETRSPAFAKLRMARNLWRGESLTDGFFFSSKFRDEVRNSLARERYDLILVYSSSMAQYVPEPAPAPVVIDFVDVDSDKWANYARFSKFPFSWLYSREARLMARTEAQAAEAASMSVVCTAQEAAALSRYGRFRVEVVANGVSRPTTSLGSYLPEEIRKLQPYVLFVGQMDYFPNVDAVEYFAEEMLPQVRKQHPDVRFVIAGRNPTGRVRRLGRNSAVVVTGTVPDVQPYVLGAAAFVAPFRIAHGIQNKILEALAVGTPVVSTARPAAAIGARHGEHLLIAERPEEFAQCVINLLEDSGLRQRLKGAPDLLRATFDWQTNLKRFESLLTEVSRQPRTAVRRNPVAAEVE